MNGDTFSGALTRNPGEAVGRSKNITQGTLALNTNYALTFVGAKLTIQSLWTGFLQPINDTAHQIGTTQSKLKTGQTIPAKFVFKNAAGPPVTQSSNPTFTRSANRERAIRSHSREYRARASRWPPVNKLTGAEYHYNWSTKGLSSGVYVSTQTSRMERRHGSISA